MAEKESLETTIVEERVELMVDHTSSKVIQNPTKRIAHFLNPTLNPNALPLPFPKIQSFSSSSKPNVVFHCISIPLKGWQTWVENLRVTHEPVWRKAGIFDAIKCSTYQIARVDDLILSLVEKWCPETNTFVFPWGEATVTLEDVFVLGGFSPLGVSVSSNSSSLGKDVEQVKKKLIESYRKLTKTIPNLSQSRWQEHFMGCGNQLENAGFLALWLARHVFAGKSTTIVPRAVLSMAARLSCGDKLAFGPVILASIYRDLTSLKRKIVGSLSGRSLRLTSPLYLVQVWAWERFPSLGPVPRMISCGEIRLARWASRERILYDDIDNMKMCLDSSRENFRWRPYTMSLANWSLPKFYVDAGKWVDVDSDKDWKLFFRCLVVGQLVGLKNCVEVYNPHRVALQFGFDQDIPESIDRSEASCKLGWLGYKKNLGGLKLYIPSRLHEGDVTHRYSIWWRARSNFKEDLRVGCKRKKRTRKKVKKMSKLCDGNDTGINSEEEVSSDEDEVLYINHRMGECSNNSEHCSSHYNVEGNEINIRCNELAETELNTPCEKIVGSDFGKVRPEGGSKNSEINVRDQSTEHNVETEVKTPGFRLAEEEPAATLCEDKDPMNQADFPAGGQLPVSIDANWFVALCTQYESRISRLERKFSALLGTKY